MDVEKEIENINKRLDSLALGVMNNSNFQLASTIQHYYAEHNNYMVLIRVWLRQNNIVDPQIEEKLLQYSEKFDAQSQIVENNINKIRETAPQGQELETASKQLDDAIGEMGKLNKELFSYYIDLTGIEWGKGLRGNFFIFPT